MTCSAAGVKSVGVDANTQQKSIPAEYLIREFGAQNKAAWQAITRPRPTVLGPKEYGVANALSRPQS
jgi:vancomycin permeability regulator SanA